MRLLIVSIFLSLFLVGCATKPKPIEIIIPPTYSDNIPIPKIEPPEFKEITWDISQREDKSVIFVLTSDQMDNLVHNLQEMKRYVLSSEEVRTYLIKVIDARKIDNKK